MVNEISLGSLGSVAYRSRNCRAAVEDGDHEKATEILKSTPVKEQINVMGPEGDTLLHLACLYAHEECAQLLLEHGADVTVVDEDCSTVLHDAAAGGCVPTLNDTVSVLRVA